MNKAFEAVLSILGDGWEKWSVSHSQQDLWKSFQPVRCTYNLQPDLRESFSADVCTDINGQFGCGHRAIFRHSVGEKRGIAVGQCMAVADGRNSILCYFVLSGNTPNYKPKYLKKDENGKKNKTRERNNELETEVVSRFFHFVYRNYFFFAGSSHYRFCIS